MVKHPRSSQFCHRCGERIATHSRPAGMPLDTPRCPNAVAHRTEDVIDLMRRIQSQTQPRVVIGTLTSRHQQKGS